MITVAGYELDEARRYGAEGNLWVADVDACADAGAIAVAGVVRLGLDPLGAQSSGDIVAISFAAVGSLLAPRATFATVEEAKFVGPLRTPAGGRLRAFNEQALQAPGAINADPLGVWLVELVDVRATELDTLVCGEAALRAWFERSLARLRNEGMIAE